jgi:hypothetical protein
MLRHTFDSEGFEDGLRRPRPEERDQRFDVDSNSGQLLRIWAPVSTRCRACAELGPVDGRGGRRRLASKHVVPHQRGEYPRLWARYW